MPSPNEKVVVNFFAKLQWLINQEKNGRFIFSAWKYRLTEQQE